MWLQKGGNLDPSFGGYLVQEREWELSLGLLVRPLAVVIPRQPDIPLFDFLRIEELVDCSNHKMICGVLHRASTSTSSRY